MTKFEKTNKYCRFDNKSYYQFFSILKLSLNKAELPNIIVVQPIIFIFLTDLIKPVLTKKYRLSLLAMRD